MSPVKENDLAAAGRKVIITRIVNAARELVWEVWTCRLCSGVLTSVVPPINSA